MRALYVLAAAGAFCALTGCAGVPEKKDSANADVAGKSEPSASAGAANVVPAATASQTAVPMPDAAAESLKTDKERQSYAMGMTFGIQFKKSQALDADAFVRGLRDTFGGGRTLMTEPEARAAMASLQSDLKKQQSTAEVDQRQKNKQEGEAFLAANKSKDGVVTLDSGLQYKVIKAGSGKKPQRGDAVVCNYRGMFVDGREFDSSYKRNAPATFTLDKVIKGWDEGLQLMPVGSKWQLFVPPNLAYGEKGAGRTIGPNSTLIFEVELVAIKDAAEVDSSSTKPAVNSKRKAKAKAAATG